MNTPDRPPVTREPYERDGNPFLGIAIGLAITGGLIGTLVTFFGTGAWRYIGVLALLASVLYLANVATGSDR